MPFDAERFVERLWYGGGFGHLLLAPFSGLFAGTSALRREAYARGWLRSRRVGVPVIVVGNLTVGGTGKTPVTIWLAGRLRGMGYRPGVVSRGYGGVQGRTPMQASAGSDVDVVGDEPLLTAIRSRCPVVVHPDRVAAAEELIAMGVDVIIADDGLQHYRLQRDVEIAVIDGARGLGNGWRLPAGPLREAPARLAAVDRVLVQKTGRDEPTDAALVALQPAIAGFHLVAHELHRVDGAETRGLDALRGRTVHAVAGIGNPERFFRLLEAHGMQLVRHSFPDHARLSASDLAYDDERDIVMTEKDAVKCREFATGRHWYVPVDVEMHDSEWLEELDRRLRSVAKGPAALGGAA